MYLVFVLLSTKVSERSQKVLKEDAAMKVKTKVKAGNILWGT